MSHQSELISSDIQEYLAQHENKELLRFLTCGSVDDGKSTLIGRLLHDAKMIYEDQLAEINADNQRVGNAGEHIDLALLVDGLQAEREQGITIDVAYRYFSTDKRKFIIADTPGHEQYTRNMATGASNCDLAIILIDARHGVQTQTKRHSFITSMLGIKHTIVAVNKMDLVNYSQERFEQIQSDYLAFTSELNQHTVKFIPVSALQGDNIVNTSSSMPWFQGQPLIRTLETIEVGQRSNQDAFRFPVQYVNRPNQNFRGYAGTLTSGSIHPGDQVTVLPSGKFSRVKSIIAYEGELQQAFAPMSVTLTLDDEIDISRGDIIVHSEQQPTTTSQFEVTLIWLSETPLVPGKHYEVKLASKTAIGKISRIHYQLDINTLNQSPAHQLSLNSIAHCEISVESPVVIDNYHQHKGTGSFIIIDRLTNNTVAAGMVDSTTPQVNRQTISDNLPTNSLLTAHDKARQFGQQPVTIIVSGACEEVRNGILFRLEKQLVDMGHGVAVITDNSQPLSTQPLSASQLASLFNEQGLLVLTGVDKASYSPDSIHVKLGSGSGYDIDLNHQTTPDHQLVDLLQNKGLI